VWQERGSRTKKLKVSLNSTRQTSIIPRQPSQHLLLPRVWLLQDALC